jgi:hypothetical protein
LALGEFWNDECFLQGDVSHRDSFLSMSGKAADSSLLAYAQFVK